MTCRNRVFALALTLAAMAWHLPTAPSQAQSSRWGQNYLPNVELKTQDNQTVRFYDDVLKGKIVAISFIYTSCLDICPLITARMAQAYERLGDAAGRDVFFVPISIDPERDTPERLKRHADAFRSDPNWVFLTGKPDDVALVRRKLGERSRKLTEHGAQIMLYNDRTGEWLRDSAFADLGVLAVTMRNMDPAWRNRPNVPAPTHASTGPVQDMPGQALYAKACASCHLVGGGRKIGPDLKGLTQRRDRDWLERFIMAPARMHAEKDPIALELAAQFPAVRMPNLQLSKSDVADLLSYINARDYALAAADMAGPHSHAKDTGKVGHSGKTSHSDQNSSGAAHHH